MLVVLVLLWLQNYWASEHGKKFCTLYQIAREKLPLIVIIDPRSGEIVQRWEGFLEPQDMTEKCAYSLVLLRGGVCRLSVTMTGRYTHCPLQCVHCCCAVSDFCCTFTMDPPTASSAPESAVRVVLALSPCVPLSRLMLALTRGRCCRSG